MDPKDFFGKPVLEGKCIGETNRAHRAFAETHRVLPAAQQRRRMTGNVRLVAHPGDLRMTLRLSGRPRQQAVETAAGEQFVAEDHLRRDADLRGEDLRRLQASGHRTGRNPRRRKAAAGRAQEAPLGARIDQLTGILVISLR